MGNLEEHHSFNPIKQILKSLHDCLYIKNEIRGNDIFFPDWGMTVTPQIETLDGSMAVLGFHITDPDFDEPLYECCASTGKDINTAIGLCVGSFCFAFMNGLFQMKNGENGKYVTSTFAGKKHTWKSYNSDIIGMGESVDEHSETLSAKYWDMLKDEIIKRLGDRKMCYVKIFASKAIGKSDIQVTGECRVNDVASEELGEIVRKHAEKWNIEQFASQKQFFFIKQDNARDYPYSGIEGRRLLRDKVKMALELFNAVDSDEDYHSLPEKLEETLGDKTLAQECFSFLPEMCTEHAFGQVKFPETLKLIIGDNDPVTYYQDQLSDYFPISRAMFSLFSDGVFGEDTDNIYRKLIGFSASYNSISQLLNDKGELNNYNCALSVMYRKFPSDFEIR